MDLQLHPTINQIEMVKRTRAYLLNLVKDLSTEQLNLVPHGFNNNIIWNLGHMIAAQQGVCYARAGLKVTIDEAFFLAYKTDTKPTGAADPAEIDRIKAMFLSSIERFEKDYQDHVFSHYIPWTTRYGIELKNIEDVIQFLLYHEGLHLGYIMALRRLVAK
jgi:hypothetical protein